MVGVSADTVKKQAKFAAKNDFPFPLLADAEHAVAEAYGIWKEKSFMGRKYMGVDRVTFVLDRDGVVRHVFPKVKILGHAEEALAVIRDMG